MNGLFPCVVLWASGTRRRGYVLAGDSRCLALAVSCASRNDRVAAVKPWTNHIYTADAKQSLAGWRALIPPGTDVVWAADLLSNGDPSGAWLLLERPSYFSSAPVGNRAIFAHCGAGASKACPCHAAIAACRISVQDRGARDQRVSDPNVARSPLVTSLPRSSFPTPGWSLHHRTSGPPFNKLKLYICP